MAAKGAPLERVNVNLPRPLLDDLRRLVPRSRRSEVIARATARELRRLKLAALLEELAREPAWRDQGYRLGPAEISVALDRLRGAQNASERRTRRKARRD